MKSKHRNTLKRIFADPPPIDLEWAEIESMLVEVGVVARSRPGSRVALAKDGEVMVICRPHAKPLAVRATLRDLVAFLRFVGVVP